MTNITVNPDFVNSVGITFLSLIFPTESRVKNNKEFFDSFSLSQEEKDKIISTYNLAEKLKEISEYELNMRILNTLSYRHINKSLEEIASEDKFIKKLTLDFSEKYKPRFEKLCKDLGNVEEYESFFSENFKKLPKIIKDIYNVDTIQPSEIRYQLIDCLSPSAKGEGVNNIKYIYHSFFHKPTNFLIDGLIHESIGHYTVTQVRKKANEIISEKTNRTIDQYSIEEGFVKSFTDVILSEIIHEKYHNPNCSSSLESYSHEIFESRIEELKNKKFDDWYIDIIKDITKKI